MTEDRLLRDILARGRGRGRIKANFTRHLGSLAKSATKTSREKEAHTLAWAYPASTPRRDIVMRLRRRSWPPLNARDTRRGIPFPKSARFLLECLKPREPATRLAGKYYTI